MEIKNILLRASNKDETVTAEDLLAIAILPITLFKTESDTIEVLKDFKKLMKNNDDLDDEKIKENIIYLMNQAGFEYPNKSMEINSLYYPPYENKPESLKTPDDLIEHFTNSLYYIHEKVHRETVESDKEKLPFKKIDNAMNFFDSMQKINASDRIKEGAKDISRFSKEVIKKIKNIDGTYTKKPVRVYKDRKQNVLNNIIYKKENNKKTISVVINPTIILPKVEAKKLKEDDLIDSIEKELNEVVSNKIENIIKKNDKQETGLNEKYTADRQNVIGSMLAYYFLTEKERYTEESFKNLMSDTNVIFRDIRSKLGNEEVDYYLNVKFENNKLKYGNNKYTKLDQGFATTRIIFLEKVANGYLMDKDISDINVQNNLIKLLGACKILMQENWTDIDITKDHITDIVNKQILEKNNENELKRTKAKTSLASDIDEKDKKYTNEADNLRIYTKLSWYRALKEKATEYKNIVVVQAKKSIPTELKKILKMKP